MYSVAYRNVAQSGSALVWGASGRGFKSRHSDQKGSKWAPFGRNAWEIEATKKWVQPQKKADGERRFCIAKFFKVSEGSAEAKSRYLTHYTNKLDVHKK